MSKKVFVADDKVTTLRYEDRANKEMHDIALEGIFLQIELLLNTDWLKGMIDLCSDGEIIIDDKSGAKASLSAFDYLIRSSAEWGEWNNHTNSSSWMLCSLYSRR